MAAEFSGEMQFPGGSSVTSAKHAVECANHQGIVIAGRHGQGANRRAMNSFQLAPGTATVVGTEDAAVIIVEQSPGRYVHRLRIGRIEDDVIENVVVARAEVGKNRPRIAAVLGKEKLSRAGAQEDAVGIAGIVGEAADVAAFRPNQLPIRRRGEKTEQHPDAQK